MTSMEKAQLIAEAITSENVEVFRELAEWDDHTVAAIGSHLMAGHSPRMASILLTSTPAHAGLGDDLTCMTQTRGTAEGEDDIIRAIFTLNIGFHRMLGEQVGGVRQSSTIANLAIDKILEGGDL